MGLPGKATEYMQFICELTGVGCTCHVFPDTDTEKAWATPIASAYVQPCLDLGAWEGWSPCSLQNIPAPVECLYEAVLGALGSGKVSSELALLSAKHMEVPLMKMDQGLLSVVCLG